MLLCIYLFYGLFSRLVSRIVISIYYVLGFEIGVDDIEEDKREFGV